jgi:hypothetical protein
MLEIAAESGTEVQRQSGGSPLVAMISVEISHRIILPKRSGESRFAPQQYCYAASKSGVVPSLPLTASRTSQRDGSNDVQRDAA